MKLPSKPNRPLPRRRRLLGLAGPSLLLTLLLSACGGPPTRPDDAVPAGPPGPVRLLPGPRISSGFLAAPSGPVGLPQPIAGGQPVRLTAPVALALRGQDLLVVDPGLGRIWRIDLTMQAWTTLQGAPVTPQTLVAIGPDLGAWLLDPMSRQVLRYARDGRLLQRLPLAGLQTPTGLALAEGGAVLLVADAAQRAWFELVPAGAATPVPRTPIARQDDGQAGVDAVAAVGNRLYLLDRRAGRVRIVDRDGRPLGELGAGELRQPVALAADRRGRVVVLDAQDRSLKLFVPGRPMQVFGPAETRAEQPVALALDEGQLVLADRATAQVLSFRLQELARP